LDKSGNILPATATAIAGYQWDIIFPQFRDVANGVTPTVITTGLQGTFVAIATQIQVADRPIYGGNFKL